MPRTYTRRREDARFFEKVEVGDCWQWLAALTDKGYGAFYTGRKAEGTWRQIPAHRWAWEHLVGPIPAGMELDHLCRNRACVNPDHLEPVTPRVNQLRGYSASGRAARRQYCPQGHPYDKENTRLRANGNRVCRTCANERCRRRYHERVAS